MGIDTPNQESATVELRMVFHRGWASACVVTSGRRRRGSAGGALVSALARELGGPCGVRGRIRNL